MKGQILNFEIKNNSGVITTEDGSRYTFLGSEWLADGIPTRGQWVDFDINTDGDAISIYKALNGTNFTSSNTDSTYQDGTSALGIASCVLGVVWLMMVIFDDSIFYDTDIIVGLLMFSLISGILGIVAVAKRIHSNIWPAIVGIVSNTFVMLVCIGSLL